MENFTIITDSSCDLPSSMIDSLKVGVVPLSVRLDDTDYVNYLDWREIAPTTFYNKLRDGSAVQTSAPSIDDFISEMTRELLDGNDVLCLSFSSTLSNTYNTARIAGEMMSEKFPDRKIIVIDTLCGGMGQGLLVYLAVIYKRRGNTIEDTAAYIERLRMNICHLISVADLKFIRRGGRISTAAAAVGSILNIRPLLHLNDNSAITSLSKVRTKKALINAFVDRVKKTIIKPEKQTVFISHADCEQDAREISDRLKKECGIKRTIINYIGPVLGAHGGPGALAVFYIGECR